MIKLLTMDCHRILAQKSLEKQTSRSSSVCLCRCSILSLSLLLRPDVQGEEEEEERRRKGDGACWVLVMAKDDGGVIDLQEAKFRGKKRKKM